LKLKCNANYSTGICYLLSEVLIFVDKCAKSPNSPILYGFNKRHRARDTIELLRRTTSDFVAPDMYIASELTRPKSGGLCHLVYVMSAVCLCLSGKKQQYSTCLVSGSVHMSFTWFTWFTWYRQWTNYCNAPW